MELIFENFSFSIQATCVEPPDQGIGAAARVAIGAKLLGVAIVPPWQLLLSLQSSSEVRVCVCVCVMKGGTECCRVCIAM